MSCAVLMAAIGSGPISMNEIHGEYLHLHEQFRVFEIAKRNKKYYSTVDNVENECRTLVQREDICKVSLANRNRCFHNRAMFVCMYTIDMICCDRAIDS